MPNAESTPLSQGWLNEDIERARARVEEWRLAKAQTIQAADRPERMAPGDRHGDRAARIEAPGPRD